MTELRLQVDIRAEMSKRGGHLEETYLEAGSSKEATNTSVPSWSGRRNFRRSPISEAKSRANTEHQQDALICGIFINTMEVTAYGWLLRPFKYELI